MRTLDYTKALTGLIPKQRYSLVATITCDGGKGKSVPVLSKNGRATRETATFNALAEEIDLLIQFDLEGIDLPKDYAIETELFEAKRGTCSYVPSTFDICYDDDDNEIMSMDPADDCGEFVCDNCGGVLMYGDMGWFQDTPPYGYRGNYCPWCGEVVVDYYSTIMEDK